MTTWEVTVHYGNGNSWRIPVMASNAAKAASAGVQAFFDYFGEDEGTVKVSATLKNKEQ
jgi:hypothetical protein